MVRQWIYLVGLLTLSVLTLMNSGCQTYVPTAGVTLPSPDYLDYPPEYIERSPEFPLANELNSLQRAQLQQATGQALPPRGF